MHKLALPFVLFLVCTLAAAQEKAKDGKNDGPKAARPTNLNINTKADEDEPYSTGSGLYYATNASGGWPRAARPFDSATKVGYQGEWLAAVAIRSLRPSQLRCTSTESSSRTTM